MNDAAFETLTPAECRVLRVALGRTNDQIARELGISPNTVAVHMLAARKKLGSPERNDAARAFLAWKAPNLDQASSPEIMADRPVDRELGQAEPEFVREARTAFDFSGVTGAAPKPELSHARSRTLENAVLAMLVVTLVLASIRYLPDLASRAQDLANYIDPSSR